MADYLLIILLAIGTELELRNCILIQVKGYLCSLNEYMF